MKPGDSRTSTVSLPICRDTASIGCERRLARLERPHDLDELHLVDRIEEVHARRRATASVSDPAISVMLSADVFVAIDRAGRRVPLDVREERQLEIDALRRRFDDEVGAVERLGQVCVVVVQPRQRRRRRRRRCALPSSTAFLRIASICAARLAASCAVDDDRTAASS